MSLVSLYPSAALAADNWHSVDDPVMGGVSSSIICSGPDGHLLFNGTVSLENNGGFASAHVPLEPGLLAGMQWLELRARGDGRRYSLRLRQDEAFDGISYRQDFVIPDGDWQRVRLPLDGFEGVFRGRRLPSAGPLEPQRIIRLGLLIARQPGPFQLEIQQIRAGCDAATGDSDEEEAT